MCVRVCPLAGANVLSSGHSSEEARFAELQRQLLQAREDSASNHRLAEERAQEAHLPVIRETHSDPVSPKLANCQKNPRAHKNEIGTPPPPKNPKYPPPLKRGILRTWRFSAAERKQKYQASIKLTHPFPAPESRTKILRTRGFF